MVARISKLARCTDTSISGGGGSTVIFFFERTYGEFNRPGLTITFYHPARRVYGDAARYKRRLRERYETFDPSN